MKQLIKGIWFIGKSGVGKTTASNLIKSDKKSFILIDGDEVRKYISNDLGYDLKDRKTQVKRLYGIAQLILKNNLTPIISSVYMSECIYKRCKNSKILVINIERDIDELKKIRKLYNNKKNVVGLDLPESKNYDFQIENKGTKFYEEVINIWKKHTLEN